MWPPKNTLTILEGFKWAKRKQDGTYAIKKDLDMNDKRLKIIPPPVEDADAVNKIYADTLSDETKRYINMVTPFKSTEKGVKDDLCNVV